MKTFRMWTAAIQLLFLFAVFIPTRIASQTPQPVVVTARLEKGTLVYRVNGKIVEDSKDNSLITNLAQIAKVRGSDVPVSIIVDVRAPFTEIGKLETALDKAELSHSPRLFVTNFRDSTMNEIHWDETPIPIPSN
jgi:hypothetical protein